ncbi:MAG TPA: zf-HC2 domain-containing protein [Vicinamibacterales bacterium]|nr:zf-HC2 domain-containing protein [Vicinamibacterales bacterium]
MSSCRSIDPLVTRYVDGDLAGQDRALVDEHLRACPPCHSRVGAERAVRAAIDAKRAAIGCEKAPPALRAAYEQLARLKARAPGDAAGASEDVPGARGFSRAAWRARFVPFALAASLILVLGAAFLYQVTAGSTRVLAAELTADHMKCLALNAMLGTHELPGAVESSMASSFGWNLRLPADPASVGLELVGARPCLYGEGKIAHIMYRDRHAGQPVSLFMLPKDARAPQLVSVLGHEAKVWCVGDRTFVMIAREPRQQVERLAEWMQASVR